MLRLASHPVAPEISFTTSTCNWTILGGLCPEYPEGATTMLKLGLTARYQMAKALVFAGCALAGLAGFFIPWLALKALR